MTLKQNPLSKFTGSFFELKSVYSLAATAMLLALRIVLGMFANATLPFFGNTVKISAAFMPIAVTGYMFGPIPAALVGGLGDVIAFFINPVGGGYFPGFTISGILTGLIYGFSFYKSNVSVLRVIIAWLINALTVETFLAAFWLYILYGSGEIQYYLTTLGARFISIGVKALPEMALIFTLGKISSKITLPKPRKT